jgi:hypothetical protein
VIINNNNNSDEAKGASSNINTRRSKEDMSLKNTFAISELALGLAESINTSGL